MWIWVINIGVRVINIIEVINAGYMMIGGAINIVVGRAIITRYTIIGEGN